MCYTAPQQQQPTLPPSATGAYHRTTPWITPTSLACLDRDVVADVEKRYKTD